MNGFQPFLVANQRTSVDLGMDSWKTPQDAFQELLDGFTYRENIIKRSGFSWADSIPHVLPNAMAYQNITAFSNGPNSAITVDAPHGFPLASTFNIRLSDVQGLTSPSGLPPVNGTRWVATVTAVDGFTINNDQAFGGAWMAATGTASYFPGLPVMAIANWIDENNNILMMALDTRRASIYSTTAQALVPIGITDQFSGDDSNYFWWENYRTPTASGMNQGKIYFTNNVDSLFYWDSSIALSAGLTAFAPIYNGGGDTVERCLMIKSVSNRLALFNTEENGILNPTRIRWCQAGADPTAANVWLEDTPGLGYFFDLTDSNYLISLAKFPSNIILMSQGERFSTYYEMRPVSDPRYSFTFVSIGTSRNINATFGTILLDKVVTTVGNSGLVITDVNSIARYDSKIPDFVLNDIDLENISRCFGMRNDAQWQTWMLYPSGQPDAFGNVSTNKNDRILIYNYQDNAFSFYRIEMCCLGLVEYPKVDPQWDSYGSSLPDWSWDSFSDETWLSSVQRQEPLLMGGDYTGNIWYMNSGGGDKADNVAYLQPEDRGTPIEFNLTSRQWFPYAEQGLASQFGYIDLLVDGDADTDVTVNFQIDNQGNNYLTTVFSTFPYDNIQLASITNIVLGNPTAVTAPDHLLPTGSVVYVYGVQGTDQLNDNSYTVTSVDSSNLTLNVNSSTFGAYTGEGWLSSQPLNSSTFWRRVYCGQIGVFHQLQLVSSGIDENLTIHAMMPWFKQSGRIYR